MSPRPSPDPGVSIWNAGSVGEQCGGDSALDLGGKALPAGEGKAGITTTKNLKVDDSSEEAMRERRKEEDKNKKRGDESGEGTRASDQQQNRQGHDGSRAPGRWEISQTYTASPSRVRTQTSECWRQAPSPFPTPLCSASIVSPVVRPRGYMAGVPPLPRPPDRFSLLSLEGGVRFPVWTMMEPELDPSRPVESSQAGGDAAPEFGGWSSHIVRSSMQRPRQSTERKQRAQEPRATSQQPRAGEPMTESDG